MKKVLVKDEFCSKKETEQRKQKHPIVKHNRSSGNNIFKCNQIQNTTISKNGKTILTDEKWYTNNDNINVIKKQKQSKQGNKEDIFPKIRKKTISTKVPTNCTIGNSCCDTKTDKVHVNELKCWIKSKLGNKLYFKQQHHQRNTERLLLEQHTAAKNIAIASALTERKLAFKTFLRQIYDLELFKKFYVTTAHNSNIKQLFHRKTTPQKASENYYHPLIDTIDNEVLEFAPLPTFEMTQLINLKKKPQQPREIDSDMDEDEFIDELLTEIDNDKTEMKKSGTTGLQKKNVLLTKLRNNNDNNETNNGNPWQIEGTKSLQREHRDTFENTSIKHIPINLPKFESEVYEETSTNYIIPIMVTIRLKKGVDQSLNQSRWLVAILKSLQMVHHDTYIGELIGTSNSTKIVHHDQVPLDHRRLHSYMNVPVMGNNTSYSTKIVIHSNNDLNSFLTNPTLLTYLKEEQIAIEHNNLTTTLPKNVGFIEQVTASRETTILHKVRLDSYLPSNAPAFQVCIYRVYGNDKKISHFVMIQSNQEDVATLTEMLININDESKLVFFPWSVFVKAPSLERQSVVEENRKWNNLFHSIVVDGFIDNDDDNKMNFIEDESENTPNGFSLDMSVAEYLQQLLHPITRNTMFDYVYPSVLGKREFIISEDNFGDIENYLALLIGELSREMTDDAIIAEFSNPEYAVNQAKRNKWKPFSRVFVIPDTPTPKQYSTPNTNKRSRTHRDNDNQFKNNTAQQNTSSRVTQGISFLQKTTNYIPLAPITAVTTQHTTTQPDQEVIVLRGQVLRLEGTVNALTKTMNSKHDETQEKIDKLEENLTTTYKNDMAVFNKQQNLTIDKLFDRMSLKFDSSIVMLSEKIDNPTSKLKVKKSNNSTLRQQSLRSNTKINRISNEIGTDLEDTDNDMEVSKENIEENMINHLEKN
jgi:hypothetical protein